MGPLELAGVGWTNKSDVPQEGKMPIHYSGARYGQSMKAKRTIFQFHRLPRQNRPYPEHPRSCKTELAAQF